MTDPDRLTLEQAVGKLAEVMSVNMAVQVIELLEHKDHLDRQAIIEKLRELIRHVDAIAREFSDAPKGREGMLRDNAKNWTIKEQIYYDLASRLAFQFEVTDDPQCPFRLHVFGDLPHGNRTLNFRVGGECDGGGTHVGGLCKPSWPTNLEEP